MPGVVESLSLVSIDATLVLLWPNSLIISSTHFLQWLERDRGIEREREREIGETVTDATFERKNIF
jgi:hypothetical protein